MVFADKKLADVLWQGLGIKYLLLPPGINADSFSEDARTGIKKNIPTWSSTQATHVPPAKSVITRQPVAKTLSGQPKPVAKRKLVPVEEWPPEWQQRLQQTKKGRLAWTYWNLSNDLLPENPDMAGKKARGNFMRRFFRDLAFPAGTHTFWPANLPDQAGKLVSNEDVYWAGLSQLGCRAAIIMGSTAARALLAEPNLKPMTAYHKPGQFVWVLWDIDSMINDENLYKRALSFLKNALRNFG